MKPGLQFRLNQQLTLTPQLQQAIRLLQLSQLELEAELRQIAEGNPLLEFEEEGAPAETEEESFVAAPAEAPSVDHNVRETLGICDRAYILNEGEVLSRGTPAHILADEKVREVYLGREFKL